MKPNEIVDRDAWVAARTDLLAEEKALTRARDALVEKRRALPWVRIATAYEFDSETGRVSLANLFGAHSQLAIYHFMYPPEWEEGCPSCCFWADTYNQAHAHLAARDTAFAVASRAPLDRLKAYKARLDWDFNWVSTVGDRFNRDFGVTFDAEEAQAGRAVYNYRVGGFHGPEAPGLSVFAKSENGAVYHTYSTYGRGLEEFNGIYHLLDMVPKGRDEDGLDHTMSWLRRRDQY